MRFVFQMTNALTHQKKHVTLIRKPVKLDEAGFSLAKASGFSQKFNNGRVFIEVNIITKNKRLPWLVNKPFLLFVCFVECWWELARGLTLI